MRTIPGLPQGKEWSIGTSHSNEVILGISGDASAVKAAVLEARQVGLELLIGMGSYPEIPGTPYL